ncbi:MAG TPA: TIGR03943 family protein [Spirochaetota bacterium]|nr:TIGR03943 family protein [Spirochaetota bacterium]
MKLIRQLIIYREFIILSLLFISIEKIISGRQLAGYINPDYHIFVYLALFLLLIFFVFALVFASQNNKSESRPGMVNYAVFMIMIIVMNLPHDNTLFYNHLSLQRDFSFADNASGKPAPVDQSDIRDKADDPLQGEQKPGDSSSETTGYSIKPENMDNAETSFPAVPGTGDLSAEVLIVYPENFYSTVENIFNSPEKYLNKKLEIIGFVYKSKKLKENRYIIARLVMWCCAADAGMAGLVFNAESTGAAFTKDEWLVLRGHIEMQRAVRNTNDAPIPVLIIEWYKRIAPENPYIYPVQ